MQSLLKVSRYNDFIHIYLIKKERCISLLKIMT